MGEGTNPRSTLRFDRRVRLGLRRLKGCQPEARSALPEGGTGG